MARLFGLIVAGVLTLGHSRPVQAFQIPTWQIRAGIAFASGDGHFQTQRANGKIVTSNIDEGRMLSFRIERRVSRRTGLTLGVLRGGGFHFEIRQDFPDGNEFEARDRFRFTAITAGAAVHLRPNSQIDPVISPFLLFGWYDDVTLESAGPPYDRNATIDVDVSPQPGLGLLLNLEIEVVPGIAELSPWIGLAAVRFTGPFPADPDLPGSEGDIGVGFSPAMVGVSLGVAL